MIDINFLQIAHNSSGKTVTGNTLAYDFFFLFFCMWWVTQNIPGMFFWTMLNLLQARETNLRYLKNQGHIDWQADAISALHKNGFPPQTNWAAHQPLWKMHRCMHTYVFWKEIHSQLSLFTRIGSGMVVKWLIFFC